MSEPHIRLLGGSSSVDVSVCPSVWIERNGHTCGTHGCHYLCHVPVEHAQNTARMSLCVRRH